MRREPKSGEISVLDVGDQTVETHGGEQEKNEDQKPQVVGREKGIRKGLNDERNYRLVLDCRRQRTK